MAVQGKSRDKYLGAAETPQVKNLPAVTVSLSRSPHQQPLRVQKSCSGFLLSEGKTEACRRSAGYTEKKRLYNSVLKH